MRSLDSDAGARYDAATSVSFGVNEWQRVTVERV